MIIINRAPSIASFLRWRTAVRGGLTALLFIIAACSVGEHPEMVTYTVNSVNPAPQICQVKNTIEVLEPSAAPGLDSQRIAVMDGKERINYFMGVKWAAPVSEMLQGILVDSFERSNSFAGVSTGNDNINADIILMTDVRDYEVTNTTDGEIHIRLVAKLVSAKDRKILATIPVERTVKPQIYKMDSIIAAFNSATADAAGEIVSKSIAATPHCKSSKASTAAPKFSD